MNANMNANTNANTNANPELKPELENIKAFLISNIANIKKLYFYGHWNSVSLYVNDLKIFGIFGLYDKDTKEYFALTQIIKELLPRMTNLKSFNFNDCHDTYYPNSGSIYGPPLYIDLNVSQNLREFETDTIKCKISFGEQLHKMKCVHFTSLDFFQNAVSLREFEFCLTHNDKVTDFLDAVISSPCGTLKIKLTNIHTIKALKKVISNYPHTILVNKKNNFVFELQKI